MSRKQTQLGLAVAAVLFAATAHADPGRSVEELLDLARAGNPTLRAAQSEAEAARERIQPAGALPDPMLKIELMDLTNMGETGPRFSPSQVGSTQYTISQQLPLWGKRELRRGQAETQARVAGHGAEDMTLELLTLVKRGYAQYWQVVRTQALSREIAELDEQLEKLARTRYAAGLGVQQDVIRAQLELSMVRQEQIQLDAERRSLHAMLNGLLARRADAPLADPQILRPLPPAAALTIEALIARLKARNPQIAAEAEKIIGAEKGRELTYRNRLPDLNLGITPVQKGSGLREWQLMFEVNLPLQFETRRSQEREAARMLDAAQARADSLESRLIAELSGAALALESSRQIEAQTETTLIPLTEASLRAALVGYENGRVDFATLLEAQRAIRKVKQDLIRVRADQQARLADLERLTGDTQ
ncbi:TolC family protein [Niveibacterium terrae]|uniref:TolC family protein n=1 Tax=Niveibacterium terrae TaxID=3373598 RepID=UPI003A937159